MDKTKSKLAAFFDNDEDESSFPPKPVDDAKLSQYTAGTVRKSRREKEQEAAEAKKREEEADAARAYAEFIDAFEGEGSSRRKAGSAFVRSSAESRSEYKPLEDRPTERRPPTGPAAERAVSPSNGPPRPKGKRNMDMFLEEIKREQADREAKFSRQAHGHGRSVTAMAAYDGQSGSKDRGDPLTTNLFVANLPPHVTEQTLGQFFARMGPVGSVKVMWPRTDATIGPGSDMTASRRAKSTGLSGFVSFMKRKDAERALREFDGFDWGGSVLRVGWSKAVPLAAKPLYVSEETRDPHDGSHSPSPSRHNRRRSYSPEPHHRRSRSRSRDRSHSPHRSKRHKSYKSSSRSRSPRPAGNLEDEEVTETFVRAVAAEVKGHDSNYADALLTRERNNPRFAFLRRGHRFHTYYNDLLVSQRALDPEFDDDGYNSVYSTDSEEESERERVRRTVLGKLARRRFESMLRAMTGRRGEVGRCMAFCLEHAEAAHEVADIIVASLLVDSTAVPRKVARLHLICDILHNSAASVPSAWKFRMEFQSRLGIVFDHLNNIYHSFPGRMTADTFKKQILSVVEIWEDWIVFPPDFTAELRERLEGPAKDTEESQEELEAPRPVQSSNAFASRFTSSSFQPATVIEPEPPSQDEDAMDLGSDDEDEIDGKPVETDDVDGEPIDDIDGEPVDDVDGEPVDLDGQPVDDDVDGIPIDDDDIDGEPIT